MLAAMGSVIQPLAVGDWRLGEAPRYDPVLDSAVLVLVPESHLLRVPGAQSMSDKGSVHSWAGDRALLSWDDASRRATLRVRHFSRGFEGSVGLVDNLGDEVEAVARKALSTLARQHGLSGAEPKP